jgi:lipopolysaccharide/colanic/teichoic acid biosynthesis glycosyltransferase
MSQVRINDIEVTVNDSRSYSNNLRYVFLKRAIDVFGALFGLVILSPILIAVGIAIKFDSKGPIFYSQVRVGKDGKCFKMYKFRSMVTNAEELLDKIKDKNEMDGPMFKIKKDPRITNIGKFIRRTSIDELPQLMNILNGDMSLVGPRPSLPNEVAEFEPWMIERLSVKPGLTCFWQVSGRNNIGFKEWMEMDIKYVRERNTLTDLKLILKTAMLMLGDKNAH